MRQQLLRFLLFVVGLYVCAAGIALTIIPQLGVNAWDVLHIGLTRHLPITVGQASQGVGFIVIMLGWLLGQRPKWGTFFNMVVVGFFIDHILSLVPMPEPLWGRWVMLVVGCFTLGLGIALYISADFGAGPRDGLTVAVTRLTNWPVAWVKNGTDGLALLSGWLLGGPVGLGTIASALLVGPAMGLFLKAMAALSRRPALHGIVRAPSLRRDHVAAD